MLTDCVEVSRTRLSRCVKMVKLKLEKDRSIYKVACCTVFVCFDYSTSFSNGVFSSFKNSTKEARLLRNDMLSIKMSQLIFQVYKLSCTVFKTKARVVNVKHDLLHIILQVNQSKT